MSRKNHGRSSSGKGISACNAAEVGIAKRYDSGWGNLVEIRGAPNQIAHTSKNRTGFTHAVTLTSFAKNVTVSACARQCQYKYIVLNALEQQPIRLDMTRPRLRESLPEYFNQYSSDVRP